MSGRVALVTDSTAFLPAEEAAARGIRVVPLQVVIDGAAYVEGTDEASPLRVAAALSSGRTVTTSRPAPERFLEAYRDAAHAGAGAVVSVHLSADMSGTHEAALLAAEAAPVPVRVVDSRVLGMALGLCVLSAAEAAAAGEPAESVAAVAEKRAAATSVLFYVDTLEHLRRGGRIGAAQALLGSALAVKPLLHLVDGRIQPLERVRTATRAIARLEELAAARAGADGADVVVHHLAAEQRAQLLAERLAARLPAARSVRVVEVGAVVGAHVGPGLLAVVVSPV
jgi:DegV family protein with EDD domain